MNAKENLRAWHLLAEIDKQSNLSLATKSLGIDKSTASKLLTQLEDELGFSLLDRSKRPAVLTWDAKKLLPYVGRMLANWDFIINFKAQQKEHCNQKNFDDEITVSLPVNSDGSKYINFLTDYCCKFPGLRLQFTSDCGEIGLLNGTADIAWFGYRPKNEDIYWINAGYQLTCILASKTYIKRFGQPRTIQELAEHRLLMRGKTNGSFYPVLENGKQTVDISSYPNIFFGDATVCRRKLIDGEGIAIDISLSFVEEYLKREEIVPILHGWHRTAWPISIACLKRNKNEKNIKDIMETIKDHYSKQYPENWVYWYKRFNLPMDPIPFVCVPSSQN